MMDKYCIFWYQNNKFEGIFSTGVITFTGTMLENFHKYFHEQVYIDFGMILSLEFL